MLIEFRCPYCGHITQVAEAFAGQSAPCRQCGQTVTVPLAGMTAPPPRGSGGLWIIIGVVAVILLLCVGTLGVGLFYGVQIAREARRRVASFENLQQIGFALHNHHDVYNLLPAPASKKAGNTKLLSWRVHILPYVEGAGLHEEFRLDEPWDSAHNRPLADRMPFVYRHPKDPPGTIKTRYLAIVGENCVFRDLPFEQWTGNDTDWRRALTGRKFGNIVDGLSSTLMLIEVPAEQAVIWTQPDDWELNDANLAALVKRIQAGERVKVLRGDASVHGLSNTDDEESLRRMMHISDRKF